MKIPVGEQLFACSRDGERCYGARGSGGQGGQGGDLGRQIGADGAGIGQGHAALQPKRLCGSVQAMQVIGIARPQGQGKGHFNGPGPQAAVACQPRKPDGKQPSRHPSAASNRR